jgi:glutathione synthase/RimK-type ligase-like ATP-grasp enzyme
LSAVLVFADEDDVGIRRLVAQLAMRRKVKWWRFGGRETDIEVDVRVNGFRLKQGDVTMGSDDFSLADVVIYKRRWLQPRPLVRSGLEQSSDRAFSEREWKSLLEGVLLEQEARSNATWLNAPSAWARTHNKLSLMLYAVRSGLPVPPFRISTPIGLPAGSAADVVTKAISADEEIDATRHFSTVRMGADEIMGLSGRRVTTPALLQEYVEPEHELRAYCILGQVVVVRLNPSAESVDIRYSRREEMNPRRDRLPHALEVALTSFASSLKLNYCAFDLIVASDGEFKLIDVTPAGSWDYFESTDDPFLSVALADAVESYASTMEASPA